MLRRIVVDTNLLVPSLYRKTPLAERILSGEFLLCLCPEISNEVYQKIDYLESYLYQPTRNDTKALLRNDVIEIFKLLEAVAHNEKVYTSRCPPDYALSLKDPFDRCFLWTAYKTDAEYLLTGDGVLLAENTHHIARICRLNDFWGFIDHEKAE